MTGVPPSGSGLRPFGVEPQDASQAEPLVPNADCYDTYVFCSKSDDASRALFSELKDRFPFADKCAATRMTAWASGDAMSVSDAMRMALECEELDQHERIDLALSMDERGTWAGCLELLSEWDLALDDHRFVEASAIDATPKSGAAEGESAVPKADAPDTQQ